MKIEHLVEKIEITERKDGQIYRTKSHGFVWVSIDVKCYQPFKEEKQEFYYVVPSTSFAGRTYRTVT